MNYIALLRGINVGGHKKIKMAELRQALESSGLTNVQTYIQSGNITLQSEVSPTSLEAHIKKIIHTRFFFEVPVVIRTAEEWRHIVQKVPYDVENYLNKSMWCFYISPLNHKTSAYFLHSVLTKMYLAV
ncbi:DUF1697 domain-containing protein [Flavobacteriaceae bacterium F08102]|nr:DUF1697 domain-containing protein [Flavobacteriaceae bacterium F08102]